MPIWSELDVGAELCSVPYVVITGTNGKTTTTSLVASMLRAAGLRATACGNIGHPFAIAAREGYDALAVEASSFQLRFHRSLRPRVSVLLNLAPDHLDWHGSLEAYGAAKARVYALQGADDVHVGNAEDAAAAALSRGAPCRLVWFRSGPPREGEVGVVDDVVVARLGDGGVELGRPRTSSAGFVADCAAAAAAALAFGLEPSAIAAGMAGVEPLPHRGEEVARIGGVRFVDDSKATNVHAALHALRNRRDVVLIAGGVAKGVDLSPLRGAAPSLAGVVAIGAAAPEILALFRDLVPVGSASSIEEAVRLAHAMAPPEGTVLLAPACASWDMFRDYVERGERFAAAVRALREEVIRARP
ncbi:UDP-N-acetylmuramoylalanine--D-glutamate ligase [bacterium HR12]|nr:UDP-N-acetylmuramoylalanine--D-glutamate ligase [bacterium HR12]